MGLTNAKPFVGVSRCLLGDAVRYDGKSKANHTVLNKLKQLFELIPVCPEVEAGLSIPRPPVQLTGSTETPRLTGRDDLSIDITSIMQNFCEKKPGELKNLHGFIFKSHSPSCGLNSTPVFIDGQCATETSRGVFARAICSHFPGLPVIEDSEFSDASISTFVQRVHDYAANKVNTD